MKRPKTSNKKISWFSIASVFLLAIALVAGGVSTAQAATTGSFDRDYYLPDLSGTVQNDYDRAWLTVTDTSVTSTSIDTITVTVKAIGGSSSAETTFLLKETGATTTVFTVTGTATPIVVPLGTQSGYVEDFFTGSHNYPALGSSVAAVNLLKSSANAGGDATAGASAELTVATGNTMQLLYGGSTLDTAIVTYNSGAYSFSPSSVSAVETSGLGASSNLFVTITDPDENLNPNMKDVIGFADGAVLLSGSIGTPGTGSSRVQIEAIDQTSATGGRLTNTTDIVARNIMLVETGKNTGRFTASGKVYGTTTAVTSSADLKGNVYVGSSSTSVYSGGIITLGSSTASADDVGVQFRIVEVNASGTIGLIVLGGTDTTVYGTIGVAFKADSTPRDTDQLTALTGFGTASVSQTHFVGTTTDGKTVSLFGTPTASLANYGTSAGSLVKLIDGANYCLLDIVRWSAGTSATYSRGGAGSIFSASPRGGSVSVELGSFILPGPRSGDTIKVSYLDELRSGGTPGTVTGTVAYGVAGETGSLSVDKTTADINDFIVVSVTDGNLNNSSSSAESVAANSSQWGGTTTHNRGDRLSVVAYTQPSDSNTGIGSRVSLTFRDGYGIHGTQTVRIAKTDNTLVWMVPVTAMDGYNTNYVKGSQIPYNTGSVTIYLGTNSVSTIPLVKGATADAKSFLATASSSSFVATLDGLDNTVEISPDDTLWISVPIVENGANSSNFIGTIGFDFTAVRVTTSSSVAASAVFTDATGGTSTTRITIQDIPAAGTLSDVVGTGSVVRISDGVYSEYSEVLSIDNGNKYLNVGKLSNTSYYTPYKTWVQVLGADMEPNRLDTLSSGSVIFRIGGYKGATYRIRYNDATKADGTYSGGDTLAVTTSNVGFTTNTGSLSVSPTGTVGLNSQIVVTLVDDDLNTGSASKQTTYFESTATWWSNFTNSYNENGLGNPVGTSTMNSIVAAAADRAKNGRCGKMILASRGGSSITSSGVASETSTVPIILSETDINTGTFKGTLQLNTSATLAGSGTTAGGSNVSKLKVSNGDTVVFFYNDSPSASVEDNTSAYTTASIATSGGLGSLNTSRTSAYLSGDNIVVTLYDNDLNTTSGIDYATTSAGTSTVSIISSSDDTGGQGKKITMTETGGNSGSFLGTFKTGAGSAEESGSTPATVRAVASGTITVKYADSSPAQDVSTTVSTKNFGAVLAFSADSVDIGGNAVVSLYDPETNTSITTANSTNVNVKSTTDSTGTTLRLTETGNDTGSFLGTMEVTTSSTLANTRIKAAVGDTLTTTFTDSPDSSGSVSTVTDTATVGAAATPTPTATPVTSPTPTPTATPVTSPTPTPTTGAIQVTVISSAVGQPIAGATVSVDTGETGTTGADGTLVIPIVEAGDRTVTASATGFESSSQTVTVTAGGLATVTFDLVPSGVVTPTPTVTPTPPLCDEPEAISVSPTSLTLKRKKSGDVTVTVTCDDEGLEGQAVKATINAAGKKRISITPSATTDASGEATFTITAKKKTGSARVTFKAGSVKKSMTVKVRK